METFTVYETLEGTMYMYIPNRNYLYNIFFFWGGGGGVGRGKFKLADILMTKKKSTGKEWGGGGGGGGCFTLQV